MRVIKSERIVMCDIDDTLVMHRDLTSGQKNSIIDVTCRATKQTFSLEKNKNMIRLLKEEKHRGATIIVWSRGGYEWAADVVTALGLEELVDTVLSKPLVYFDDKPVTQWLTDRVYIGPDENYKSNTYKA